MARRAQERLLLAQVAREIQANLRHMEQVLDAFFRDHDKRADLASLAHDSKQIMGALKILGLDHAEQLLTLCQQQIDEYAKPETRVANVDLELLAESLSGLGFYIEAVEQQRPDRERLIEPLLAKRLGVPAKPRDDEHDTVEAAMADVKAALPATLAAFQRSPGEQGVREHLAAELTTLKNDAELIGDAQLQTDAEAALDLLTRAGTGDTAALQDAIAAIAGGELAAPAPPSEETLRLLETDASQLDAELLDIYLTEADEVVDSVATNAAALVAQPDDREALTTVRRGFHTLKGSGRMVGLTELGEIAYEVEKVHNRILEDDLPVTPAVLSLIDVAQTSFRVWVDTLRRKQRVTPDATALRAAIAKVEAEFPAPPAMATSAPEAPSPVMAVIRPAAPAMASDIEVIELDETPLVETGAMAEAGPSGSAAEIIEFTPRAAPAHPGRRGLRAGDRARGSDHRRRDAVDGLVPDPLRRGAAASFDPGRGVGNPRIRRRGNAIAGDGACRPHPLRDPPHGRIPAAGDGGQGTRAMPARPRGARPAVTLEGAAGARARRRRSAHAGRPGAFPDRVWCRRRSGSRRDRDRARRVAPRGHAGIDRG